MFQFLLRDAVQILNDLGTNFCGFAAEMLFQFGLLFGMFGLLDAAWLKRKPPAVRYGVCCLLLVKLILPVWLQGPIGFAGVLDQMALNRSQVLSQTRGVSASSVTLADKSLASISPTRSVAPDGFSSTAESLEVEAPIGLAGFADHASVTRIFGSVRWQAWLFLGWVAGVLVLMRLFINRLNAVHELSRTAVPADDRLQRQLHECLEQMGLNRLRVNLCLSQQLSTPAICGFWRPTILLPTALAERLNDEQLRLVLVHELLHWTRFDVQVNGLQTLLGIVYFYNPLVWLTNGLLRRIREQAVDQAVLATVKCPAQQYSALLLDIVSLARNPQQFVLRMIGAVESRKALSQRIRLMLSQTEFRRAHLGLRGVFLLMLVGVIVLPLGGRTLQLNAEDVKKAVVNPQAEVAIAEAERVEDRQLIVDDEVKEGELAGVVQDEDGRPLAGVTVDAWSWSPGSETQTDENGRFRLGDFDSKRKVEVLITKEGYSPQHFPQRPTGEKNWVIKLGQKTYIEGTVIGNDGMVVAGASIRASFGPVQGDGVMIGEVTIEGATRKDGTYRLYVAPGIYDIQISAGPRGVFRQGDVNIESDEVKSLDVQLRPGVHFAANVIDSVTGEPLEGFVLWQWRPPKLFAKSDADGHIVLDGLLPGKTTFDCGGGEEIVHESGVRLYQHGGFGRWWSAEATNEWMRLQNAADNSGWQRNFDGLEFDLSVGMPSVTIVVEQGVEITGRVTDPDGKPVVGATVAPAKTGSGNSLTGDTRYSVRTDKDGLYKVVLPASNVATYNLIAHDGDYQEWRNFANGVSEKMKTIPGQKIDKFDLQLTKPAVVRGRVVVGGQPVKGREVRTHASDKRENRYYDPTTKTAADGTFELKFVRPGKHHLQVEPFWLKAEDAQGGSTVIDVKPGEVLEGIELVGPPLE